jgi:hypothetical protein
MTEIKALARTIVEQGMTFGDMDGALIQARHWVGRTDEEALARELVRLSEAVPQRPVVWVLWVDRAAGSVSYSWEYEDDECWLSPGPHYTRFGTYQTEAAVQAAAKREEDYFRAIEDERSVSDWARRALSKAAAQTTPKE